MTFIVAPGNTVAQPAVLVDTAGEPYVAGGGGSGALANQVQGNAADSATAVGNPVHIGGVDSLGRIQSLQVNPSGAIFIAAPSSVPARLPSSAATTNATLVKNAAGTIFHIFGMNTSAATKYLKFYNKATAPTVGTDTPYLTLALPPTAGFAFDIPEDLAFSLGIGYAITGLAADADATAVAVGDVVGLNVLYS